MKKIFYSPESSSVLKENLKKSCLIRFSFYDEDIPHFAKTGTAKICKIYADGYIVISINKKQEFFHTSTFGEGMNLTSGLLLYSLYEDNEIVIFKIPQNYIWCILNK